ncbi:MAG: hypothetical protein NXI01_00905 [Gammaproteobacteria bacterium]|nr:hypothetical protein [Gammaproteobacteria bacterium]
MAVVETLVVAAAANSGLGTIIFNWFMIALTFLNIYLWYKSRTNRTSKEPPIDSNAIRHDREARAEQLLQNTSDNTAALQANAQRVVDQYQAQQAQFGTLISDLEQKVTTMHTSTDGLEANQAAQTTNLQLFTQLLASIKEQYQQFCALSASLFANLTQTQEALVGKEQTLGNIISQLNAMGSEAQQHIQHLSQTSSGLPAINEIREKLSRRDRVISQLRQDKSSLEVIIAQYVKRLQQLTAANSSLKASVNTYMRSQPSSPASGQKRNAATYHRDPQNGRHGHQLFDNNIALNQDSRNTRTKGLNMRGNGE